MARLFGCSESEPEEDPGYGDTYSGSTIVGRPHVVVKFLDARGLTPNDYEDTVGHEKLLGELWRELERSYPGIRLRPLFRGVGPARLKALIDGVPRRDGASARPNLFSYFQITGGPKTGWDDIAARVNDDAAKQKYKVENAYVERPGPDPGPVIFAEPKYYAQRYLHVRPRPSGIGSSWIVGGIDTEAAWAVVGGCGQYGQDACVHFVDVERGWKLNPSHVDLPATPLVTWPVPGGPYGVNYLPAAPHGTATLGILCMRDGNNEGGVGGAPHAKGWVVSCVDTQPADGSTVNPENTAAAILAATEHLLSLRPGAPWPLGDVIVIERQIQLPDPNDGDRVKWVPVELLDSNRQMIRLAADYGITVVEAGGNGSGALGGSPPPLNLDLWPNYQPSGAIIVSAANVTSWRAPMAAAYAPIGRQRIDCFGWGNFVITSWTDTNGATNDYTTNTAPNVHGYTSAATAIVAAAAICLQGIARAGHKARPLSPEEMRQALRNPYLNTPAGAAEPPIGVMPNLAALAPACANGDFHLF